MNECPKCKVVHGKTVAEAGEVAVHIAVAHEDLSMSARTAGSAAAQIGFLMQEVACLRRQLAQRTRERDELKRQLLDEQQDHFFDRAWQVRDREKAGWWDSMGLSSLCSLGDVLVEAGRLERHPDGYGRRWFYRLKVAEGHRACEA